MSQSPLVQTCAVNSDTVTVILAVVIPVCAGVALLLAATVAVLVLLHRRRLKELNRQKALVNDIIPVGVQNGPEADELELDTGLDIQVPRPNVQYYRNPAAGFDVYY